MITTFEAIKRQVSKSGKCLCGKRLTRSTTLQQTINPFNKNKDGVIKTYREIFDELMIEAKLWKEQPVRHYSDETYYSWDKEKREQYDKGETIKIKMTCGFYDDYKKK